MYPLQVWVSYFIIWLYGFDILTELTRLCPKVHLEAANILLC